MSLDPRLLQALGRVTQGFADSALHKHYQNPKVRRKMAKQANERASKCTPCAAGAYVENLRQTFGRK